jgi:hypothetical protein
MSIGKRVYGVVKVHEDGSASSQRDAVGKPTDGDGSARQVSLDLGEGGTMKFVLCPAGENPAKPKHSQQASS